MLPREKLEREKTQRLQGHSEESSNNDYSDYEKIVIVLSFIMLITILIFAAWSEILLLAGTTKGGGPLGMIMNVLPLHLLLD